MRKKTTHLQKGQLGRRIDRNAGAPDTIYQSPLLAMGWYRLSQASPDPSAAVANSGHGRLVVWAVGEPALVESRQELSRLLQ